MSVTTNVEEIKDVISFFRTRLGTSSHWHTACLRGADRKAIGELCLDQPLPFTVLWLGAGDNQGKPRQVLTITVIVCVDGYSPNAESDLSDLIAEATGLLDGQVYNNDAEIRLAGSESVDLDPHWLARQLNFRVSDH